MRGNYCGSGGSKAVKWLLAGTVNAPEIRARRADYQSKTRGNAGRRFVRVLCFAFTLQPRHPLVVIQGCAAGACHCGTMNNEAAHDNNISSLWGWTLQRNYRSSSWSKWSCGKSWRENSSIWKVGNSLICDVDYIWSVVPKVQNAPLNVPPSDLALGAPQIIFRIKWSVSCPTERKWSSSCRLFEVRLSLDYYLSHIDVLSRSVHFKWSHRKRPDLVLISHSQPCWTANEKWHLHIEVVCSPFL